MKIEEMTYNEAKWWILNDWEFIELKGSEHFKRNVMLLFCEGNKNIFFADKKTGEPIHTYLYIERNKKITRTRLNDRTSSSWVNLRVLKKKKLALKDKIASIAKTH